MASTIFKSKQYFMRSFRGSFSPFLPFFQIGFKGHEEPEEPAEGSSSKSGGLPLFIIAASVFLFTQLFGVPSWYAYASLAFMIYSSIALFDNKGLYLVIIFSIWYLFLGAYDFSTIKSYLIPIALAAAIIHGIVVKVSGKGSFVHEAEGELAVGAFHILIFTIDVGLISWIIGDHFLLPDVVRLILAWVPLWAYVGLFVMLKERPGKVTTALTFVGIAYLIAIITLIPGTVEASTFIPGQEELAQIKERSQIGVNPALVNLKCTWLQVTGGLDANIQACVTRETDKVRYTKICKDKGLKNTREDPALDNCIKDEERKDKEDRASIEGAASSIESTEVHFKAVAKEDFPFRSIAARDIYPITLDIQNPRRENLRIEVACQFMQSKEVIAGEVSIKGERKNQATVSDPQQQLTFECIPSSDLNGAYDLEYTATLFNVKTPSSLKRAFIPALDDYLAREELEKEVKSVEFPSKIDGVSQAPEKDFARINFKFGLGDGTNPIVPVNEDVRFSFSVENQFRAASGESGKILRINSYSFDGILARGFVIDASKTGNPDCLVGGETPAPSSKTTKLKSCWLRIPADLKNIDEFKVRTFDASFDYDYQITHKTRNVRVERIVP